ncbi:MAG: UTP--glucose-1-phosphate uridylyltransferase [Candidatus Dormiibacterota bacterium]
MGTIRHCVVPAAGLGTRFLPATKVLPKEMLPVVDRPLIEWAIEEAMAAGAAQIALVIATGKELIQAHFMPQPELERVLEERGKLAELAAVRHSQELAQITYVLQERPLGLGHAVLCAAEAVGDHPFLCMLPDDLSHANPPILAQLRNAWEEVQSPVLALMRVPRDQISRYGCATVGESRGRLHRVTGMVEKPAAEEARSDLAIMGRYVLPSSIFSALRRVTPGAGGELQLTDGIAALLDEGEVWGLEFEGELLDVGTPDGWLTTNVRLARELGRGAAVEAGLR